MTETVTIYDPNRGGRTYLRCDPLTGRIVPAVTQAPAPGSRPASSLPGAGLQPEGATP